MEGTAGGDHYLTASQAAAILQVSPKTVSRWAAEGKIRHILTLGGHRRFPRQEIERIRAAMGPGPEA